jgi:hypothetical protein
MTVEHLKRLENQRRGLAQVSEFSGAKVEVKADTSQTREQLGGPTPARCRSRRSSTR